MAATEPAPRVLIADDQRDVREALRLLLKGEGFAVELASSPAGALEAVSRAAFDAVLIDLNYTRDTTSGAEGLDLLEQLLRQDANLPVVVMTAWGTIELAVEAMRRGARDFVEKPWDNARLTSILRNQVALKRALQRGERLAAENLLLRGADEPFVARAPAMQPVVELIKRVAPSSANVLITGEPGTGKGLVARLLHENSLRAEQPFISVNMGSIPETMFESEMFGHVKGAFTDAKADRIGRFELADRGTLFLDEIGNVPYLQQGKLLRVLESGEHERIGSSRTQRADVRVVAATNADLQRAIADGTFRKDLLFRINTVEVRLPPLRERREDIVPLAERYLAEHARRYSRALEGFTAEAERLLLRYAWPGNVRELAHAVERAVLLAAESRVGAADLRLDAAPSAGGGLDGMSLEDAERVLIRTALARCGGKVEQAALELGLSRSALYRRLEKLGIETGFQKHEA
jgi:DNA-binding NtrC family response regulator